MIDRLPSLAALALAGVLFIAACAGEEDDPTAAPEAVESAPVATEVPDAGDSAETDSED